jgi:hypothetical protein
MSGWMLNGEADSCLAKPVFPLAKNGNCCGTTIEKQIMY